MPSSDLSDVYAALQAADAAGNTADAQQIASYISSLSPRATSASGGVTPLSNYAKEDTNAPWWQQKYGPLSGTSPLYQAAAGAGGALTDIGLGAKQAGAELTGGDSQAVTAPFTGDTAVEKRQLDAPLAASAPAFLGKLGAVAPAAFLPGANTGVGATAIGGLLGATQPTIPGESRALNTLLGAGSGLLGNQVGNGIANWAPSRAAEPLMGWSQKTGNRAVAEAVGSTAPQLNQPALAETNARLGAIFNAARSPNVTAPLGVDTARALSQAGTGLNRSSLNGFTSNQDVQDLIAHLRNGSATAEQLGQISSRLGREANSQMTTKDGDRALGRALFDLQGHVDGVVGNSITDPSLAQAYREALPQYRTLSTLEGRPSLLNSATGDVNLTALGKYLQRADKPGYTRGGNTTPLYEAARWGQASGLGKGAPKLTLGSDLGFDWLKYWATRNPASRAATGVTSRALAPIAPAIPPAMRIGGFGAIAPLTGLLSDAEQ